MKKIFCSVAERFVNPLFEVFDGGDFILSSYRDIEEPLTQVQIFFEDAPGRAEEAKRRLTDALGVVGVATTVEVGEIPDEDWKLAYRRHFKIDPIGARLLIVPTWELDKVRIKKEEGRSVAGVGRSVAGAGRSEDGREIVTLDPGMAFGTGKHETTRACLTFIESLAPQSTSAIRPENDRLPSFLDMGCGSGILSIAAAKLGYGSVTGFDVDQEAVDASRENAAINGVSVTFFKYGLGAKVRRALPKSDLVVANILGPLLIRFADEIVPTVASRLVISGILAELYPEVLAAYTSRGLIEVDRKTFGEWTTGLLSLA